MAGGGQGWPEFQAIPAATIDHVWNAFFGCFLGRTDAHKDACPLRRVEAGTLVRE